MVDSQDESWKRGVRKLPISSENKGMLVRLVPRHPYTLMITHTPLLQCLHVHINYLEIPLVGRQTGQVETINFVSL